MTFTGEWQTDAELAWASAGYVETASMSGSGTSSGVTQSQFGSSGLYPVGDWASALADAWSAAPSDTSAVSTGETNIGPQVHVQDNASGTGTSSSASWRQSWTTLVPHDVTVNFSFLPASVYSGGAYVDPNVVGVEWEPTSTPLDQKLTVRLMKGPGAGFVDGEHFYVHAAAHYAGSAPYAPGYMSAAAVAAIPVLGYVTADSGAGNGAGMADLAVSIPLTGTYALPLTVLDQFTEGQTPLPYNPGGFSGRVSPFRADLMRAFRPRYRLIYADPATGGRIPPIRHVQRGDGLGLSTAPRMSQLSSIQGSLRNSSYL